MNNRRGPFLNRAFRIVSVAFMAAASVVAVPVLASKASAAGSEAPAGEGASTTTSTVPDGGPSFASSTAPLVDLEAGISALVSPIVVGQPMRFEGTYYNYGPDTATNLVPTFTVGSNLTIDTTQMASQGCTTVGQVSTCPAETKPADDVNPSPIWLWVTPTTAGTNVSVELSLTSDGAEPSPDPHSNSAQLSVTVEPHVVDLRASFTPPPGNLVVGQTTWITANLANYGPGPGRKPRNFGHVAVQLRR